MESQELGMDEISRVIKGRVEWSVDDGNYVGGVNVLQMKTKKQEY